MIFPQFNVVTNPMEECVYSILGDDKTLLNASQVMVKLKENPNRAIVWHIPKGYVCIKILNGYNILPILIETNSKVFVYQSKLEGFTYIICKADFKEGSAKTVVGIAASYITTKVMLPFKLKSCTMDVLNNMSVIYSKGIEDIPDFLYPATGKYSFTIPIKGNPTDVLVLIARNFPKWSVEKKISLLKIINNYFCDQKRTDDEINAILGKSAETNVEDFFVGNDFKHDALGEYLIKLLHIKKDSVTGTLYYYNDKKHIYESDPEFLQGYITKNYSVLKEYQRKEVITFIDHYLYEESIVMNENPYTIVFNNGILNVITMELEPMTEQHLESIKINYNYSKYAYSETVDEFFKTLSCNDKQIETLFFEAIGYGLLKTSELQTTFTLTGEGRNGKSTYLDLIKKIVGKQYYTSIAYKDLANNFRASDLIGKLVSVADDISSQPLNDSDLYKSIAGGEDIMIEKKYKDAKSINLFATLFFCCNRLPRTPDTSDGFYRRQTLIPCEADLSNVSKVDGMKFKMALFTNEAIEYAIYKAVQAIHAVFERGDFTKSARVEALKASYREENSSVLSWIKDLYDTPNGMKDIPLKYLWSSYRTWCSDSNRKPLNQTNFINELKGNGIDIEE